MKRTTGPRSFARLDRRGGPVSRAAFLAGALLLATAVSMPASAQTEQSVQAPTQGITTIGYGKSSAPAESAEIQIVVTQEEFGPPRAPDPEATPGAEEREAVSPMIEGLQAVGVAEEDITVVVSTVIGGFYGPGGPGLARVDVAVDMPTQERITELINAATVGAAEENLVLALVGVGYGVADCAPLERAARETALADAQTRAELQAELMGVQLGEAVAASDLPINYPAALDAYYGALTPTQLPCSPPAPAPTSGSPVSVPPFDPTDEAEVNVYAQIAVTFTIDTEAAATPAS